MRASARSTLFTTSTTGRSALSALRSTNRVWGSGPSDASTSSTMPSTMDRPRSTSPPKSAWPGVSMMLMTIGPSVAAAPVYRIAVFFARIVMPFSRSRSPESIARSSTCWCSPNAPDCQSILSTRVVLPWSTWATMATLRMAARVFMGMRDSLSGCRGWFGPRRRGWFACGSGGASGVRVGRRRAQQLLELLDDGQVGGEPPDGTEVAPVEPAQLVVVLEGLGRALDDLGEPHQHLVPIAQRPRGARLRTGHVRAEANADAEDRKSTRL